MKNLYQNNQVQTCKHIYQVGSPDISSAIENYKENEIITYEKGQDFKDFIKNSLGYDFENHSTEDVYQALRYLHCNLLSDKSSTFYKSNLPTKLTNTLNTRTGIKFVQFPKEIVQEVILDIKELRKENRKEQRELVTEVQEGNNKIPEKFRKLLAPYEPNVQQALLEASKQDFSSIPWNANKMPLGRFLKENEIGITNSNETINPKNWSLLSTIYTLKGKKFPKSARYVPDGFQFIKMGKVLENIKDIKNENDNEKLKKEEEKIPGTNAFYGKELPILENDAEMRKLGVSKIYIEYLGDGVRYLNTEISIQGKGSFQITTGYFDNDHYNIHTTKDPQSLINNAKQAGMTKQKCLDEIKEKIKTSIKIINDKNLSAESYFYEDLVANQ